MSIQNKRARVNASGHILIYVPDNPNSYKSGNWQGYLYEHRYIAERELGRILADDEVVHHLDGNPANNKWENLLVLTSSMHKKLHMWLRKGAPYIERIGLNGENSGKAKSLEFRCKNCNLILMKTQIKFCSSKCYLQSKVSKRPNFEQLKFDVEHMSLLAVGRKYGVSDNAVRKWLLYYTKRDKPILSRANDTSLEGATTT